MFFRPVPLPANAGPLQMPTPLLLTVNEQLVSDTLGAYLSSALIREV